MAGLGSLLAKVRTVQFRLGLFATKPLDAMPALKARVTAALADTRGYITAPDLNGARVARLALRGAPNWLVLCSGSRRPRLGIRLSPRASGNVLVTGARSDFPREVNFEGSDNVAVVGDDVRWCVARFRFVSDAGVLLIGRDSILNGTEFVVEGEGVRAVVGDHGLFAPGTAVRTSDLHGMFAIDGGAWINPPADVWIEPHVWFGQDALVLKGVVIGGGSVIGAKSVVTKSLSRFGAHAGMPARTVREGVCWSLDRKPDPADYAIVAGRLAAIEITSPVSDNLAN